MLASLLLSCLIAHAQPAVVEVGGGRIEVTLEPFSRKVTDEQILAFIRHSAEPVAAYYGKFPVPSLKLRVMENSRFGKGVFGREFHGERIELYLGPDLPAEKLANDHMLTHEMFHLGFPDLPKSLAWLEEGLATYLTHLARARKGQISEQELWLTVKDGLADAWPAGELVPLPDAGKYHQYRRLYWGGAFFWLETDLEIRERSGETRSLDSVLRAILASGGTNAHRWNLARLRKAVDKEAHFSAFQERYGRMVRADFRPDLGHLWRRLGIKLEGETLELKPSPQREKLLRNFP